MRTITYTLTLDDGYTIHTYEDGFHRSSEEVKPLILTPGSRHGDSLSDWGCFLDAIENTTDDNTDDGREFIEHYREIVRGERPEWMLTKVRVFPGYIDFWYDKMPTWGVGLLESRRRGEMHFTIEGPRMATGLVPKYRIDMDCNYTTVTETIGHIKREINFVHEDGEYKLKICETEGI